MPVIVKIPVNKYYSGNQIKKNEMGEHVWGKAEVHTGFWWGDLREGDHLGDPGVDGRII
jgi:hypothetical protein